MKKFVIFLFCLTLPLMVFAQTETKELMVNLEEVEVTPPKFTGIENVADVLQVNNAELVREFIIKNVNYPVEALDNYKEGTEIVHFCITKEGKVTNFKVINSVSPEIDKELIRVLKTTDGMWKPGYNNGVPVDMGKEVSLVFCLGKDDFCSVKDHFVNKATEYFQGANKQLFVKHNPKKALKQYNKGIKYLPNDKALLYIRGLCRYELGDEEGARRDWDRIVSLGGMDIGMIAYDSGEMKGYDEMIKIFAQK